jgi:hypothetical protein
MSPTQHVCVHQTTLSATLYAPTWILNTSDDKEHKLGKIACSLNIEHKIENGNHLIYTNVPQASDHSSTTD